MHFSGECGTVRIQGGHIIRNGMLFESVHKSRIGHKYFLSHASVGSGIELVGGVVPRIPQLNCEVILYYLWPIYYYINKNLINILSI